MRVEAKPARQTAREWKLSAAAGPFHAWSRSTCPLASPPLGGWCGSKRCPPTHRMEPELGGLPVRAKPPGSTPHRVYLSRPLHRGDSSICNTDSILLTLHVPARHDWLLNGWRNPIPNPAESHQSWHGINPGMPTLTSRLGISNATVYVDFAHTPLLISTRR